MPAEKITQFREVFLYGLLSKARKAGPILETTVAGLETSVQNEVRAQLANMQAFDLFFDLPALAKEVFPANLQEFIENIFKSKGFKAIFTLTLHPQTEMTPAKFSFALTALERENKKQISISASLDFYYCQEDTRIIIEGMSLTALPHTGQLLPLIWNGEIKKENFDHPALDLILDYMAEKKGALNNSKAEALIELIINNGIFQTPLLTGIAPMSATDIYNKLKGLGSGTDTLNALLTTLGQDKFVESLQFCSAQFIGWKNRYVHSRSPTSGTDTSNSTAITYEQFALLAVLKPVLHDFLTKKDLSPNLRLSVTEFLRYIEKIENINSAEEGIAIRPPNTKLFKRQRGSVVSKIPTLANIGASAGEAVSAHGKSRSSWGFSIAKSPIKEGATGDAEAAEVAVAKAALEASGTPGRGRRGGSLIDLSWLTGKKPAASASFVSLELSAGGAAMAERKSAHRLKGSMGSFMGKGLKALASVSPGPATGRGGEAAGFSSSPAATSPATPEADRSDDTTSVTGPRRMERAVGSRLGVSGSAAPSREDTDSEAEAAAARPFTTRDAVPAPFSEAENSSDEERSVGPRTGPAVDLPSTRSHRAFSAPSIETPRNSGPLIMTPPPTALGSHVQAIGATGEKTGLGMRSPRMMASSSFRLVASPRAASSAPFFLQAAPGAALELAKAAAGAGVADGADVDVPTAVPAGVGSKATQAFLAASISGTSGALTANVKPSS